MSRNGSGTYTLPTGNPVVTGTTITSSWANTTMQNIADGLTQSVSADGQTPMSGALNMATNKINNLGTPIVSTDASTKAYVDLTQTAAAITGGTITGATLTNDTIDSTPIGNTTRSTVKATTLDLGLSTQSVAIGQGNASIMKNRIINGAMVIDQRNAGAAVTPSSDGYLLDRWSYAASQTSKFTFQQNKGSVTPPTGFTKYFGCSTASAVTVGAGDYFFINQIIEGYNIADLGWGTASGKTVTLSFQVYSSLTGTFGGSLRSDTGTQNYPFSYTVSSANTWTSISVTVPAPTVGTTWNTTNGQGLFVVFGLGIGTTYGSGTAGAWTTSNYYAPTGSVSVVGTLNATFYITGVQLEVGSSATGFEYVNYQTSLANCQRYYSKMNSTVSNGACGAGLARSSTASNMFIKLPVTMRTIPTVSYSSAYLNYNSDVYQAVTSNSGVQGGTDSINYFPNSSTAGMTSGYPVLLAIGSGGYVDFSSEL